MRMTPTGAAAVARDARVAYVEPDQVIHAFASQTPATWGLDRIDQRDLPLNNTYTYNQTGAGVNAYIIDTVMRATHQQFTSRVRTRTAPAASCAERTRRSRRPLETRREASAPPMRSAPRS